MAEVSLLDVSKRVGAVQAVRGLSLAIADGEFVVLLGPTGAGKTTTLRLIAGLERPEAGSVVIRGRDVTRDVPAERDVAFVFQQYSLYPHLTVYDNLAFPLRSPARRMDEAFIRRRVQQVAELLHIEQKLANRATALSGGEMQRVAIARALANRPALLLADEPTGELDEDTGAQIAALFDRVHGDGTAIVVVTHNPAVATRAGRHLVMKSGRVVST
jgi:multiple sugar transport system ATP-binding protein